MFKRRVAPILALLFVMFFVQTAHAFFDPPWITPATPMAGETVSVNIHGGVCDGIFERPGFPQITREGNAIRIVEFGVHEDFEDFCIYPVGTLTRPIGAFPLGDYTLTVDFTYDNYPLGFATINLGVVPFTVTGLPAPVVPVPTNNPFALLALMLALCVAAAWGWRSSRGGGSLLVLLFFCVPLGVRAQSAADNRTIIFSLTNASGAPTPAQIYTYYNTSPRVGAPPLEAFKTKSPQGVQYLLPDRATGDFLIWLNSNTHSLRKKLEDTQLAIFSSVTDIPAALTAMQADPYIADAHVPPPYQFSSVELTDFSVTPDPEPEGTTQYGWFDLNTDEAWQLAGGYAFIGQIDMGLNENHAALRQFSSSTYAGGNFIKAASRDIGLTGQPAQAGFDPTNVDEGKPMLILAGACTPTNASLPPAILGHGTHVAGLLGANGASGLGVQGTCKHCGIGMWKLAYLGCSLQASPPEVEPIFNDVAADRGEIQTVDIGAQVLSMSYGTANDDHSFNCLAYRLQPMCRAIAYAQTRDVPMVAASGNQKKDLMFPASDKRVISAGGFQTNLALWDDAPNCPPTQLAECGSNYSKLNSGQYLTHQEVLGSAKRALSTTYPNTTWVDYAECGDGYGTPMGDGIGWCTGTSMSAPQIAGVFGLLRSINPLAPQSVPEPAGNEKPGLRTVLAQTASRGGLGWDPHVGYGIPDAAAAARKVLGKVAGAVVRNRVTPLFRLYDASTKDFADTTSPQYALSLMITQVHNYVQPTTGLGVEPPVPGYAFPYDQDDLGEPDDNRDPYETAPATPRAAVYVLTTEYRSRTEWPALIPLYLMEKTDASGRDFMLVTTVAEIQAAHNAGYNLRTIQGYIYQPCAPELTCVPPGAVKLWRKYRTADNDCAVFLDSERGGTNGFETKGYIDPCPAGSTTMIGYAYPSTDTDGDGLPDGFEYVVGTNPNAANSDGDGSADGVEFPMAGIPIDDPCKDGSLGARNCSADRIFKNGFDGS